MCWALRLFPICDPAGDAALVGLGDGGGEVGEVAEGMADGGDGARAGVEIGMHVNGACEEVEFDVVTVLDGCNGATNCGFRTAMHAHGTTRDS